MYPSQNNLIYLDNSATTRVDPRVVEAMLPSFTEKYGNASSVHIAGLIANEELTKAREKVAKLINAAPNEIVFMGSGSESDNFALIQGSALSKKKHIITTAVEHNAILKTTEYLKTIGYEVTYLPTDRQGRISVDDLKNSIREDTGLISIMMANNEVGTIMPVQEVGKIASEKNILYHIDAVQAVGKMIVDVDDLKVDLLTFSGHKIYAPKGIGVLFIKEDLKSKLKPLIHGGSQEYGLRAGTENIPYIVGLAEAADIISKDGMMEVTKIKEMRDLFENRILQEIPDTNINGAIDYRVASISSITFKHIEAEAVMGYVPEVCCSLGSACNAQEGAASHVLEAMQINSIDIRGTIRFSFGRFNTVEEVNTAVELLKKGIEKLRAMSPIYNKK